MVANNARLVVDRAMIPQHHAAVSSVSSSVLSSLPTFLASVQIFDGSQITDAVVVSNRFWSTLLSKLPYLILAQLLASVVFVVIASSVTAHQGKLISKVATASVLDDDDDDDEDSQTSNRKNTQFRRANDPPLPTLDFVKLMLCICIDIVGSANEAIPLVGELVDVVYAPIAALLLRQLFAGSNVVFLLEFTEEILPFTDVLPLATICWVVESFFGSGNLARALKIGQYSSNRVDVNFIDIDTTFREDSD